MNNLPFNAAVDWWHALQPYLPNGQRNPRSDRASLAALRRADLLAAMSEPATFALFRALGRTKPADLPRVALCAAVLAGVRDNLPREHPARTLGPPSTEAPEQAIMKPQRFRRLIEAETPEEQLIMLRRAVQLADRKLNVRELAAACLEWSEACRQRWIFEYYAAGPAAPAADRTLAEEPLA